MSKRLFCSCFTLILILQFGFFPVNVQAAYLELSCESAILMEEKTGKILYAKNEDQRMYPASMTKILTALITLEHFSSDEIIVTGDEVNAIPSDSSLSGHTSGEYLLVENLIRGLIIPSGNETACVAAVAVVKKTQGVDRIDYPQAEIIFRQLMNQKAKELGVADSNFMNPHGYHDDEHYTTASDLALICRAAMQVPLIRQIAAEKAFSGNGAGESPNPAWKTRNYEWSTHNALLGDGEYSYQYATGIKTGFTDQAGSCVAAAAVKDDTGLIAIVFNGTDSGRWIDCKYLFDYGFNNFKHNTLQEKDQVLDKLVLGNSKLGESIFINALAEEEFSDFFSLEDLTRIKHRVELDPELMFPVKEGIDDMLLRAPVEEKAVLGKVIYTLDGETIYEGNVLASRSAEARTRLTDMKYYFDRFKANAFSLKGIPYWIGIILVVVVIIIIITSISRRGGRRKRGYYRY